MSKIETLSLRCNDPEAQIRFYCDVLGMKKFEDGIGNYVVGYCREECLIRFIQAEGEYNPKPDDLYWKIALSVPSITLAYKQLTDKKIKVSEPKQFQDVAYLAHFTDPEGFTIELIDHWFLGNNQETSIVSSLLGGGAHLSLLTLRTANINPINNTCERLGMKLLSIQPVESREFTLYFYAFTDDIPPSPDLYAVENREWLYQRKYTVLEMQHLHTATVVYPPNDHGAGYAGTTLSDKPERGALYQDLLFQ